MWPGPYGDHGSRKYLLGQSRSEPAPACAWTTSTSSTRTASIPTRRSRRRWARWTSPCSSGKARYVGISSYGPRRTEEAIEILRRAGHAVADPPALLLDVQPLDRAGAARRARARGRRCIAFSPLAQGLLTDKYLDGIPEDSRVRRGQALSEDLITEENVERARALTEIAARPRPDAGPARDRLGPARRAGHLGADRRLQRRASSSRTSPRWSKLDFDAGELEPIDRYAVDGQHQHLGRVQREPEARRPGRDAAGRGADRASSPRPGRDTWAEPGDDLAVVVDVGLLRARS